ncbi:MAG: hypothetical protein IT342_07765 [Candidatus Melainabacteria bacterium]|nr:hypothetical protein [Candidatus Melainabacteria bacterium]
MIFAHVPQGKTSCLCDAMRRLSTEASGERTASVFGSPGNLATRLIAATVAAMFLLTSCSANKQVRFSSLFKEDDELTADIAFKIIEKSYRVKPDRRYLLALSDISFIVTGKPLQKVEAVFADGKWRIQSDKKNVTEINNFATFQDMHNSLSKYAHSLEGNQGQNRFSSNGKTVLNMAKIYGHFETQTQLIYGEHNKTSKQQDKQDTSPVPDAPQPPDLPQHANTPEKTKPGAAPTKSQPTHASEASLSTQPPDTSDSPGITEQVEDTQPMAPDPIDNLLLDFSPRSLFKAIEMLNARWKQSGGSQQSIDQAATALTGLSFQVADLAGTADNLLSKALAFTVLSKRYETVNARRNFVRIAEAMGYHQEAVALARDIDEEDPLRMYMLWQSGTVLAAIKQGLDSPEARFLYVKKLAQAEMLNQDDKYRPGEALLLPVSGFMQEAFATEPWNVDYTSLPMALFDELEDPKPKGLKTDSNKRKEPFFTRLNECFEKFPKWSEGSLIPQDLKIAFYQAFAYTYVLHNLQPENGSRTEIKAEKIFDDNFGTPQKSESGNSICTLAHDILNSRTGHYQVAKLLGDAVSAGDLGDYPRFLAYSEASRWFQNGDPKLISAAKTMFDNIDSRPESRYRAGKIAHNEILHPVLALQLDNLGFDADPDNVLAVDAAQQDVNFERLRKIADTRTRTPSHRARAMAALCVLAGSTDRGAKNLYVSRLGDLVAQTPGNFEVLRQYVQTAILAGKVPLAIANTKKWIAALKDAQPVAKAANQLLATLYYSNGNTQECLDLIDRQINNDVQRNIAEMYVNVLIQKGNIAKAEAFADTFYESNRIAPSALALKLQMLWKRKAFEEAALLLKKHPWCIKVEDWRREIYPAFKHTLAGFPNDSATAVRALAKEGFADSTDIGELARSFSFYGRDNTGFEVLSAVLSSSFSGHELNYLNLSTLAYSFLQKSENERIALKWIQEKVPPQFFTPLAMFAFQNGAYDLLWKLIPPYPQGVGSEYVWLTRAAAMPMQKALSKEENRLIIEHYSKNDNDALFQIGKAMIGVLQTEKLMDKRINVRELCDLSYFLGSRETYLGDQTAAANWYHMALETGLNKASESSRNAEAIRRLSDFYPGWSKKQ